MSFWVNSFRCSLGSPIVSRPFTLICWTPPTSRADTSKGGCNVIEFPLSSPSKMAEPPPGRMRTGGPMHYTMKIMQDKSSGTGPSHRWKVTPVEARSIQEELRGRWEGEDRLGKVRTVAGLDASFVLTESQALSKPTGHWLQPRDWVRRGLPLSGNGRNCAREGHCPAAVPLHPRFAELSRNPCLAGRARKSKAYAGPAVLRRTRLRASPEVWAR